jgi:predicted peptidase
MKFRRRICLALLMLFATRAPAQNDPPREAPTKPGDYKFKFVARIDGKPVQMTYVLILPKGYDTSPQQKFPMVVFMHGAGECGTDGESLYIHGPAMELRRGNPFKDTFPFIVLCPQCPPRGERWDQPQMYKAVSQIVDAAIKSVRADPDRVYLTGLSMGGKGCWMATMEGADRFAAIAPICAGTTHPEAAARLKYVAVMMISGTLDPDAVQHNNEMEKVLAGNYGEVRNTIVPGADHGVWAMFYANPQFYEWLLSHKRPNAAERRAMEAAGPYARQAQSPPRTQGHYRLVLPVDINGLKVPLICSTYVPKSYSPTGQPSPMILFLHEYNTIGTPYNKDLVLHGPDAELERKGNEAFKNNFPFVVLSPQIPAGLGDWNQKPLQDAVLKALDDFVKGMNIDKSRIYVTGLNEGGAAAGQLAVAAPGKFAAIAPILAMGQLPNSPTNNMSLPEAAAALKDLPNWTQVGDGGVANSLKGMFEGRTAWKLTEIKPLGVESWSMVYKNQDVYDWMLKQKKGG